MHLQASLILAIASTALALPAVDQTNSTLEKRWNHGWIGNFDNDQCTGTAVGSRPEIHLDHCLAFQPSLSAGFIGVFFGTGLYGFDQFTIYTDDKCQTETNQGYQYFKSGYTTGNSPACISLEDMGMFGSLQTGSGN